MISDVKFVKQSLETHLFFARIMKEHSFFLEVGFTPKNYNYIQEADAFRLKFGGLLADTISLSNGVVSPDVIQSGEVVTPYTLKAEIASSYYTGVQIQTNLTQTEAGLMGGEPNSVNPILVERVYIMNQKAISLISGIIQFKTTILSNVLSCKMFTVNYPLLIDHILREAQLLELIYSDQNLTIYLVQKLLIFMSDQSKICKYLYTEKKVEVHYSFSVFSYLSLNIYIIRNTVQCTCNCYTIYWSKG